ncbi:MAG: bifunctional phosphopantothenoylcysteine decarboxylase/phosphopantothenate--cysteine ligase CoaBC [Dehalococcoidia bacterium]
MLAGRHIALGITGSIAAYKAADLASRLAQAGALVDVLMTASATRFIAPLTLRGLTGRPVLLDMFDPTTELAEEHVEIARRASAIVVAPASATTMARLAQGLADDVVSLTVLATEAPVLLAPAMDNQMYEDAATQANIDLLRQRGYTIIGPAEGRLASGHLGLGRLIDTDHIVGALRQALGRNGDLARRRVVVTAGGTQEAIDPVRYVGNHSSGKMGYALAEAGRDRGAEVTLVTTPTALACPYGVRLVPVQDAREMLDAVTFACSDADVLIMAAAVADFRPDEAAGHKIKKAGKAGLTLELVPNPDILSEVQGSFVRVGFKAESRDAVAAAQEMLRNKRLDLVVANDITTPGSGFASDTNEVALVDASGVEALPVLPKYEVALRVLDRVVALLRTRS